MKYISCDRRCDIVRRYGLQIDMRDSFFYDGSGLIMVGKAPQLENPRNCLKLTFNIWGFLTCASAAYNLSQLSEIRKILFSNTDKEWSNHIYSALWDEKQ